MKIIHITIARKLTSGQKKQLMSEQEAAKDISRDTWTSIAFDNFGSNLPFSRRIPFLFRSIFLRNVYGWIVSLYYSRTHDFVLLRHITFDPLSFIFAPLIKNRVSIHHAKEVEELKIIRNGWRGTFASALEQKSGAFALRRAAAIIGVTNEIADYEKFRSGSEAPTLIYPNGINTSKVAILDDNREPDRINVGFISGTFSAWHGLDKLLDAVKSYGEVNNSLLSKIGEIHLIGTLSKSDRDAVLSDQILNKIFRIHGFLEDSDYRSILAKCDIGLSSFAMEREGLTEGCTLKVRELLAMGLPICSGHKDCALDDNFMYYSVMDPIDIDDMIFFGFKMKQEKRGDVSLRSRKFIDKRHMMSGVIDGLRALNGKGS